MQDFKSKQLTETEKKLAYLESICANLAFQIRSLAIAKKVKPEDFVEAMNDSLRHEVYIKNTYIAESNLIQKKKEQEEKLAKLSGK